MPRRALARGARSRRQDRQPGGRAASQCCESLESRCLLSGLPLDSMPTLSSLPGASARLFLDFDGAAAGTWQGYTVPATPAFDLDGDATTFTAAELNAIEEIWSRVAEKYSPFNLDVTTVDPGNRDDFRTAAVVIGGNGAWYGGGVGGIAMVRGFSSATRSNTAYVFQKLLGTNKMVAEAAAHEAGHLFGLNHQSLWNGTTLAQEYYSGTAGRAPVMGNSYGSTRGLWWYGTTSVSSTAMQDDLAILAGSTNAFGYRGDDHADAPGSATTLAGAAPLVSGIIASTTDTDWLTFTSGQGIVQLTADVTQYGAMLDLRLELRDSAGTLIAAADTSSLGETLSLSIAAGSYYVVVASHGEYGDVGQYTLTASIPAATPAPVADAGGPYTVHEGAAVQLRGDASSGSALRFEWDLDGDGIYGETGAAATRGDETGERPTFSAAGLDGPGVFTVGLRVWDSLSRSDSTTTTINIANVAPTLAIEGSASSAVGSRYSLNLDTTDPGNDAIVQWIVDWGDGTPPQYISANPSTVQHVYVSAGTYTISASASDDDGTYSASPWTLSVSPARRPWAKIRMDGDITLPGLTDQTLGVIYADDVAINADSIGDGDLLISGPHGFARQAELLSFTRQDDKTYLATYRVAAPGGSWDPADNGTYAITLQANQLSDDAGFYALAARLGVFQVGVLPADLAGNSLAMARSLGSFGGSEIRAVEDGVGIRDRNDFYRLTLTATVALSVKMYNMTDNAELLLLDARGNRLVFSKNAGYAAETFVKTLQAGTYFLRAVYTSEVGTAYRLRIQAATPVAAAAPLSPTTLASARQIGSISPGAVRVIDDSVIPAGGSSSDLFRFTLESSARTYLKLYGLSDNADLELYDSRGSALRVSRRAGSSYEVIVADLVAGTYYARVVAAGAGATSYRLRIAAA
ncbi:PKD domain-containing protein [Fontivita pretiosa]|uniref:PKD domain-containing protein n=1 Tax=Fontivita pretiosa TaxID=2989684 RepID=UPI003D169C3D